MNLADFIHGLLNHAGSDIDLHLLIDKIRNDLRIPGLRDSLCKLMQDHHIQVEATSNETPLSSFLDVALGMLPKDNRARLSLLAEEDRDIATKWLLSQRYESLL